MNSTGLNLLFFFLLLMPNKRYILTFYLYHVYSDINKLLFSINLFVILFYIFNFIFVGRIFILMMNMLTGQKDFWHKKEILLHSLKFYLSDAHQSS